MRSMRAIYIISVDLLNHGLSKLRNRFILTEINSFLSQGFPEPLDENVVHKTTLAIHAQSHSILMNSSNKFRTHQLESSSVFKISSGIIAYTS